MMNVWLVGAGSMAVDYFKVLSALKAGVTVAGRGQASASSFEAATGQPVKAGGLERFLESSPAAPDAAIVSVGVLELADTSLRLIRAGVRKLLVEKPGAIDSGSLEALNRAARAAGAEVFVAYNRRFYAATLHAKRLIEEDGGVRSCHFEFTEWAHVIEELKTPQRVKERWLLASTSHVIDLAFHLGGAPAAMDCRVAGSLPWHPSASMFAGSGVSERGVLFSYQANWAAPGRWGVEVLTSNNRFIFRPLETLQVLRKKSIAVEPVSIDDALDKAYKPGLHEQVSRFLAGRYDGLCSIGEQLRHWPHYCRIAGYQPD
jgi:predicted dehydrogenase